MTKIEELKQKLPGIKENVILRDWTTMGVGGVADLFYEAIDIEGLTTALKQTVRLDIPYFVLGSGSNVIVSDSGFPGLIIKNSASNILRIPDASQFLADSGATIAKLISESATQELTGMEVFAGIPGTVGGAAYGNAGVRGVEFGDFVKELTIFHPPQNSLDEPQIIRHKVSWMEYSYRTSRLKKMIHKSQVNKPVILTIKLGLAPAKKEDILERIRQSVALRSGGLDVAGYRHGVQPKGVKSSGCIFKNPGTQPEMAAGYLLDKAGLKKKKVGDVVVSKDHANFVINKGRASAQEIRQLIEIMRHSVKEKYNINLEEEVEYIGRW